MCKMISHLILEAIIRANKFTDLLQGFESICTMVEGNKYES